MKNLIICCEGETEELFVEKILTPYLSRVGLIVSPKGMKGVSNYKRIKDFLVGYCQSYPAALVTSMIDYYGAAKHLPGFNVNKSDIYARTNAIEKAVEDDLQLSNLMFNLTLHEFEGYLFSNTAAFSNIANKNQIDELANIRRRHETPEHINEKYETAPSRRIIGVLPKYQKLQDGIPIAESITVDKIAVECRHFANWLAKLTDWAKEGKR
ncbi:MAG: DUF4276 family protein [Defluviitaleaceae bacterium]|nr:DUF4276 family protein [Defluviitaleaceae bacterium]MCL2276011.1 DUF4276 family protein [Defluviitaleaceae bacterium]